MSRRTRPTVNPGLAVPDAVTYIEIRQAILRRDFVLEYQPKVSLRSGLIEGVEALIRWQHGSRGRLSPETFLPEAERTALMGRLTGFVLDEAVSQCASFHRKGVLAGVAVNVSPSVLSGPGLAAQVDHALEQHGLEPWWLTLEITQGASFKDLKAAAEILDEIRAKGVHLSLDDFGTSSLPLSYLQALPIDEVKLDRSLVARATTSPADADTMRSIVELGHRMHLRIIAEGVEDEATIALLHAFRVDGAQGFYLSPPVGAEDLLKEFHTISSKAQRLAFAPSIDLRSAARVRHDPVQRLRSPGGVTGSL